MDVGWHAKTLMAKAAIWTLKRTGWYSGYWNHWRGDLFDHAERNGLHVLPVHFYTPIPETLKVPEAMWSGQSDCHGMALRMDEGLASLVRFAAKYRDEYDAFAFDRPSGRQGFHLDNPAYSGGDAEILYSMVRELSPRRIIEVGSGYTTLLICEAVARNLRDDPAAACEFVAIEPYPPSYLSPLPAGVTRMLPSFVQSVPLSEFEALGAGDVLFIDSSHVASIGSDVNHLYLEILPRLASGVVVHIHDVFLPFEYPREWIRESRFFWNEQYLLQALLLFSSAFEVLLPTHALFRLHPEEFLRSIPSCSRHPSRPSSFWMRRVD
jgi:hypothetical protein